MRRMPTCLAALGPLLWAGALKANAADGAAADAGPWWLGSLALLVAVAAAAAGVAFGSLRTERRLSAALRASQRERQTLTQLSDVWSWQTDAAHRLLHMHPPVGAPTAAWSRSAPAGQPLWSCFEVASAADVAGLRARLESQLPFSDLRVQRCGDGSGWTLRAAPRFDESGHFAGHAGTARPTDEDDLRRADQHVLVALVDSLPGPALVATRSGAGGWQLRHANADALRLLQGDAAAEPPQPLHAPPNWDAALAALPEPVRQAISAPGADAPTPADGWQVVRVGGADGEPRSLLLTRLQRGPAQADDSSDDNRSDSRNDNRSDNSNESESFAYTVSHDLRAPIRVVDGFTRILKEDYGRLLDRVGNDHLDRVLGAAARMNLMIDALLALARLSSQPLAQQPVNLSQLAGFVLDDLRRSAPERVAEVDIEPGLQVVGDPTLLRLVLENLLGNAWKYSARVKRARIVFAIEAQNGRRVFVVRDNGAGFDMRSSDRLFGLFQRLHSATDFPGTGVGLASVKRIVRRHGGEIWADAEPGRGAAFYFTLRG